MNDQGSNKYSDRGRPWLRLMAALSFGFAGFIVFLVNRSYIFGEQPVRYALALAVGCLLGAAALWVLSTRPRHADQRQRWALETVALLVGLVGALYGAAGLAVGGNAPNATASACAGVPTRGGDFQILTPATGVTTRTGPSIVAQQSGRLAGECAVRVDGYCHGTPVDDISDESRYDSRWLRVYRVSGFFQPITVFMSGGATEDQFIAGGTIASQVSDEVVEHLDSDDCGTAEAPPPADTVLTQLEGRAGAEMFEVTAANTFDFGFALMIQSGSKTGDPFRQIPLLADTAADDETLSEQDKTILTAALTRTNDITRVAEWRPGATARYLDADSVVVVAGAGCLAIGAPVSLDIATTALKAYQVTVAGDYLPLDSVPELGDAEAQLARTACRESSP